MFIKANKTNKAEKELAEEIKILLENTKLKKEKIKENIDSINTQKKYVKNRQKERKKKAKEYIRD